MRILNWLIVILGVLGLVGIRMVEQQLFYDPFLEYFHIANKNAKFPDFDWIRLILNHFFRFSLNLILSALVIHFIFQNRKWTVQAVVLMLIIFAFTFPIYLYCIHTKFEIGYLFSFYMRRFVIQPLILLLIIPLFYYRKQIQSQAKNLS